MKKIQIRNRITPNPKVKYTPKGDYIPPTTKRETLSEKVIRIYPPKEIGPPSSFSKIIECTPKAKALMLEREHYDEGGVYIDFDEREHYMPTTNPQLATVQAKKEYTIDFDKLSDEEYMNLREKIVNHLIENNYSTKTLLKDVTIEAMIERYKIPNEIINSAK